MITPEQFYKALSKNSVAFYAGVPDSLLKEFCAFLFDTHPEDKHIIAANEGSAVGLAAGYHLSTSTVPVVYMQNSGLGNAVNPLISLTDSKVYGIPLLLVVGWRGEVDASGNQIKDEPQHVKQGLITLELLETLGIDYRVISEETEQVEDIVSELIDLAKEQATPVALVVRKGTFSSYKLRKVFPVPDGTVLTREDAIGILTEALPEEALIVSTTGKASRELFEHRVSSKSGHQRDFLTVGSMGHASQIAAGLSIGDPGKSIFCVDGDGAVLMHMGGLSTTSELSNFNHIVLNNGAHESVGGQPTRGFDVDLCATAKAMGYARVMQAKTPIEIRDALAQMKTPRQGAAFLEILVLPGAREDLGRPTITPIEMKTAFMGNFSKEL
jgi:phosphonopyruvate decarboxylase